jgi:hypothetical protein
MPATYPLSCACIPARARASDGRARSPLASGTRAELIHIRTRRKSPNQNRERAFGSLKYEHLYRLEIDGHTIGVETRELPAALQHDPTPTKASTCAAQWTSTPKPPAIVRLSSQPSPKPCQLRDAGHLLALTPDARRKPQAGMVYGISPEGPTEARIVSDRPSLGPTTSTSQSFVGSGHAARQNIAIS